MIDVARSTVQATGTALRFGAALTMGVVSGTTRLASMVWSRARGGWSLMMSRTRYDYRREVGDPLNNSIVAAVLGWIGRNFPEAPIRLLKPDPVTGEMEPIVRGGSDSVGGPYFLWLMEHPNTWHAGPLLWKATIVDFKLGNAYWLKRRNADRRVIELWWLPARMVEPRWDPADPSSFIDFYEYTVDGVPYLILPEDVVHFRQGIDPSNARKGLSSLGSLWRELFTDDEAANMTAALMRNLGVPGVILSPSNTSNRIISDPAKVKRNYLETFGGDERGGVMVQSVPVDVKVLSWSPEQMNLRELRRIPEERTAAVLGVPAGVAQLGAGLDRNTFSNYGEANVAAYTQGIAPDQRLIAAEIEVQLLPEFVDLDDGYDVDFDLSKASAMASYFEGVHKRARDAATVGLITRAAFKKETGRLIARDGSDDVYVIPNNYVTLPAAAPPGGPTPPGGLPIPPGANPANQLQDGSGALVDANGYALIPAVVGGTNGHRPELAASILAP